MSKYKDILKRLKEAKPEYGDNASIRNYLKLVMTIAGEGGLTSSWGEDFNNIRRNLKDAFMELEEKAIPEGMEWPRFEDGAPVRIGDYIISPEGGEVREVYYINFFKDSWFFGLLGASSERLERGRRVKRPQVLAADGEPLEVGQTVWNVEYGTEYEVCEVSVPRVTVEYCCAGIRAQDEIDPPLLTHQRPVLDADGVPIKVGDTVCWFNPATKTERSGPYVVIRMLKSGGIVTNGPTFSYPDQLTHFKFEFPDSWRQIWSDMFPKDDTEAVGLDFEEFVKRCEALSEKSSLR